MMVCLYVCARVCILYIYIYKAKKKTDCMCFLQMIRSSFMCVRDNAWFSLSPSHTYSARTHTVPVLPSLVVHVCKHWHVIQVGLQA